MSKIKVGVVGVGRIGALLEEDEVREKPCTHLGTYMTIPECEIVAIADKDAERAHLVANKWFVPNVFTDGKKMVQNCKIDLVSVCTPTETHFKVAMDVAPYVKAIFCEKPMTTDVPSARILADTCKKLGVVLAVNHVRRYCDSYRKIKDIIDSQEYGELKHIVGYASREKDFEGNIHMFDTLNWFTKNEPSLYTYVDCYPVDYMIFELDIILSDGRIKILDNGRKIQVYEKETSKIFSRGEFTVNELQMVGTLPPYSFSQSMINAVGDLIGCIKEKQEPLCGSDCGIEALRTAFLTALEWKKNGR